MKLHTREWGSGERTALLVHGITFDHRTWRRVGPELAERGYRVVAVDLRGHGLSPRGTGGSPLERYPLAAYTEDLLETLPTGPELAIGHSLGGIVLADAVERLKPARAVYVDPGWRFRQWGLDPTAWVAEREDTREGLVAKNPHWSAADVEVKLDALAHWDTDTAVALAAQGSDLPAAPAVPSLVVRADDSTVVRAEDTEALRARGFEVRTVAGAGHNVHRDDHEGFLAALDGWI
ncbi:MULTISPECIES: alpha/beta fold hydrolase [Streptomyces]|uniref:alpha/beta fold hydrolase n=1 Tax=Streptomyces TaxID=1883 RepID=UPI0004AA7605|nr:MULTISPECIES: alpha/beta fold hydrolase [Streptomyces]